MLTGMRSLLCFGVGILSVALAIGCQPTQKKLAATEKVNGSVKLQGEPVEGATVSFQPVGNGTPAVGTTDAQGQYSLTTFLTSDGAVAGSYTVAISKMEKSAVADSGSGDNYVPPDQNKVPADPKNLLPAKYANATSSGLTATVVAGSNTHDFVLEK